MELIFKPRLIERLIGKRNVIIRRELPSKMILDSAKFSTLSKHDKNPSTSILPDFIKKFNPMKQLKDKLNIDVSSLPFLK